MVNDKWKSCKNILCLRLDNFGDVLMTQPAFRALKESIKGCNLTLLTSKMGAVIAPNVSEIDDVIVFDVPWIKTLEEGRGNEEIKELTEEIRKRNFDAAIIFTNFSQSALPAALLCYLSEISKVLAYSRENPYQLISDWVPDNEPFAPIKHGVQRQLDLVRQIGAEVQDDRIRLYPDDLEIDRVKKIISNKGVDLEKEWVVLHPGVSEDKRRYPAENFALASKKIVKNLGFQIIVTGSDQEQDLVKKVVQEIGEKAFNLSGQFNLAQLIALISLSKLLICNNTGPVHIACGVETPVVEMYARTNPEHTPWKTKNRVLYFDVLNNIRTKNTTILSITPKNYAPMPTSDDLVQAVTEVVNNKEDSDLPLGILRWD